MLNVKIKSLQKENNALKAENEKWKQKWDKLKNTDEILQSIMQKNNKWWVLDSVKNLCIAK